MSLIDAIFVVSPLKWIQQKGNREKFTDLQHICCWVIVLFTQTFHYLKSGGIAKSWLFINWSWVALKLILKSQVSVFKSSGIIRHWTFFAAIVRKLLKLIQTQFETTALALINNWETWCQNNTFALCSRRMKGFTELFLWIAHCVSRTRKSTRLFCSSAR